MTLGNREPRVVDPAGGRLDEDREGPHPTGRRRWVAALVAAVVVAVGAAAAIVVLDGSDEPASPPAATAPEPAATTPAPATDTAGTATTTVAEATSAAVVLEPFLTGAATLDGQLGEAADEINAAGPPWTAVTDRVATAVADADLAPVAEAIPAGLPDDLLGQVVLVYSDLASRRAAMASFAHAGPIAVDEADLLAELGNGHAAAQRFDADLADLRSSAESSPAVTVAGPSSQAAAEVLLLVQYVDKANLGCDSRGGVVVTSLPPITWSGDDGGTIGSPPIEFQATQAANGRWTIEILAC